MGSCYIYIWSIKKTYLAQIKLVAWCDMQAKWETYRTLPNRLASNTCLTIIWFIQHSLAMFRQLSHRANEVQQIVWCLSLYIVYKNISLWKKTTQRTSPQTSTGFHPLWLRQFCSCGVPRISNGDHHPLPGWNYWGLIGVLHLGWVFFKCRSGLNKMEEVKTAFWEGPFISAKIQVLPSQFWTNRNSICV